MNAIVEHEQVRLPALTAGGAVRAIVPQDFDGAWRIAVAVCKAGMAPKGLDSPEKAMVAIMHGMEVGLTPMAALQSIAVVNGRPTIWGDGAIGLVRASGLCEYIQERIDGDGDNMVAVCEVKRKGEKQPIIGKFSVADAKKAGLWGKQGPWTQYPKRMLAMRARAFPLRDGFADVLRGLGIAEEQQDVVMLREDAPTPPRPPVPPSAQITGPEASSDSVAESIDADAEVVDDAMVDPADFLAKLEDSMVVTSDFASIEEVWTEFDPMARFEGDEDNRALAMQIKRRHRMRVGGSNG